MAKKPLIVVGHRMGKGQNMAQGLESGGAEVVLIPGMLADMKLGDKMNEVGADMGVSFCGSGGAEALSAATKYGYKEKHGNDMIKPNQFKQAVLEGNQIIGGNFAADTVENGLAIMEAFPDGLKKESYNVIAGVLSHILMAVPRWKRGSFLQNGDYEEMKQKYSSEYEIIMEFIQNCERILNIFVDPNEAIAILRYLTY